MMCVPPPTKPVVAAVVGIVAVRLVVGPVGRMDEEQCPDIQSASFMCPVISKNMTQSTNIFCTKPAKY